MLKSRISLKARIPFFLSMIILAALAWLSGRVTVVASSKVTQAFPYQAGFPRSEPKTVEFASPTVVDLNGDDELEVLVADGSGCVWAWNDKGQLLPGFPWRTSGACGGGLRINGPLAIGDVDGDGRPEIVAGTRGASNADGQRGRVFVWNHVGTLLPGWPKEMDWNSQYGSGTAEVYSVAVANLTGGSRLEILAGTSNNAAAGGGFDEDTRNLYAWHADGTLLSGYPTWYRNAGIWGLIGAADLTGDGYAEIITGRDHIYLHAYSATGQQLPNWPVRTYLYPDRTKWGVDPYVEFTRSAPSVGDLDGNGTVEIVIVGKVRDPLLGGATVNSAVMVMLPNGQRAPGWSTPQLGNGAPIGADTFSPNQAPALADINGDGQLEIIASLTDGTVRAYRDGGTLTWQYNYAQGQPLYASEPVIGDVSGDGQVDVVFGTFSQDSGAKSAVQVYGLDANGNLLPGFPLVLTHEGSSDKQGVRAAPTLADLDCDGDVEVLVGSWAGALYVWDLPALYRSDLMPWPASRHDNQRTGAATRMAPSFTDGNLSVTASTASSVYLPIVSYQVCG
ncbi:MAG TPA: FG-GAP-like repeat-containing protein [Anaerolineae bacterium]